MLDGFLCGLLLQPQPLPLARWWALVCDTEGRALPAGHDMAPLQAMVLRRHAELERAIARRQWFDPWVFELDDDGAPSEMVMPWVAGFSTALNELPPLPALDGAAAQEPLAILYRHLDPDDLEDADELLALIEELEPPADGAEAVEDLVRATLLLADLTRPMPTAAARSGPASLGRRPRRS